MTDNGRFVGNMARHEEARRHCHGCDSSSNRIANGDHRELHDVLLTQALEMSSWPSTEPFHFLANGQTPNSTRVHDDGIWARMSLRPRWKQPYQKHCHVGMRRGKAR